MYAIAPDKAMKELGWVPTTMFKDSIKLTTSGTKNIWIGWMNALVVIVRSIIKRCMERENK